METKRGYLVKQGRVRKSWKKRYFVLKDGSLMYYESEDDVVPKGQMSLNGAVVVYVEPPKVDRANCIEVSTPSRSLLICSDSRDEITEWALAIQRAATVASGGQIIISSYRLQYNQEQSQSSAPTPTPAPAPAPVSPHPMSPDPSSTEAPKPEAKETPKSPREHKATPAPAPAPAPEPAKPAHHEHSEDDEDDGEEKKAEKQDVTFTEQEKRENLAIMAQSFGAENEAYENMNRERKKLRKEAAWELEKVKPRKTLKGHDGHVHCVSHGHGLVASGGEDAVVRTWNSSTLKEIAVFKGHNGPVKAVLVHKDYIISGADDGCIKLWGINSESCEATFRCSTGLGVEALVQTSDGRLCVSASGATIQVWDLERKKCVANMVDVHKGKICSLALAGQVLFTGSEDHTIKVWDMTLLQIITTLDEHRNWVFCLAAAGDHLYSGSDSLKAWDISKASKGKVKCVATVEEPHNAPSVQSMVVSEDERYLLTASLDGFINIWSLDLKSKSKPAHSLENKTKFLFSVTLNNRRLFTADRDSAVKVWE